MLNNSPKLLKQLAMLVSMTMVLCMGVALAQSGTQAPPSGTQPETGPSPAALEQNQNKIDDYLASHPAAAKDLHANPNLINDPNWLAQHPQVKSYMNQHPDFAKTAASNPAGVVNRADRSAAEMAHRDLTKTDQFLSKNPALAKQLAADPKLIDDPKFMSQHPGLDKYLAGHPDIRQEWRSHPDYFTQAAEANHHYNMKNANPGSTKPTSTKPVAARRK